MTGFEPRTSGIGSNRSTNWATTTALLLRKLHLFLNLCTNVQLSKWAKNNKNFEELFYLLEHFRKKFFSVQQFLALSLFFFLYLKSTHSINQHLVTETPSLDLHRHRQFNIQRDLL